MQIPKLVRSVAYIPETRGIDSLFQAMQSKKIHIAIVVDEYGQDSRTGDDGRYPRRDRRKYFSMNTMNPK